MALTGAQGLRGSAGIPVTRDDVPATIREVISDCRASNSLEPRTAAGAAPRAAEP